MGSVLWERKAPAGASSDTNIHIHRTPTHTSFNFMRHYCRDTKLGRLPLGFSWLQQREPWTRFRAGARTFLDGKVTCPPLPCPVPMSTPPPTAASWCLPAQLFPLFPREPSPKTQRRMRDPLHSGSWRPWDAPAGEIGRDGIGLRAMGAGICWGNLVALAPWAVFEAVSLKYIFFFFKKRE